MKHINSWVNGKNFLIPIDLGHVLGELRHQILSHFIHYKHPGKTHLMIISHKILLKSHFLVMKQ